MSFAAMNRVHDQVAGERIYRGELVLALVVMANTVGAEGERIAWRFGIEKAYPNAIPTELRADQVIVPDHWPGGALCWRIAWTRLRQMSNQCPAAGQ